MSQPIRVVGVVGAGLMGAEIALVSALAGHQVVLADKDDSILEAARRRLEAIMAKGIERGFYVAQQKQAARDAIHTTTDLSQLGRCDLVTEAVFEREDVKAEVLRALDGICGGECIIASNTSTLPISVLAANVSERRRQHFIGTHYFSPVSRMKLVEVIAGLVTSSETIATTLSFCQGLGKTPILVKDVAGFAVNRLLHALMIEAVRLVEEGVAGPDEIDVACRLGLGHPMGPFELMDATTSRLCLEVQEILQDAYGERFRPRPLLKQRVRAGFVGGRGKPGWRSKM